ncbi:MAG: DNA polymerase III subunit beta [Candidatus Marinimicrobia bacterium]|nr:DNA polymerase III subunit beta [Candidatus Neomarinimicrobiota bacterium]|tara:strand:- start:9741 stop:10844 length:1104 start_codon:yes stop_codon:yes gene_type:complete
MKFSIKNNVLNEALKNLNRVVPTRTTLPVLSSVLFSSDGEKLSLRSTNLEVSLEYVLSAEIIEPINIAIPISKIFSITSALKNETLSFSISDNEKIEIKTDFGRYKIVGLSPENFPDAVEIEAEEKTNFSTEDLESFINYTINSTSTEDLKPSLQGICLSTDETKTEFVATDGHRLSKITTKQNNQTAKKIIIPTKFFKILNPFLNSNEQIDLILGENHAQVFLKGIKISTRLIKDAYPDYEKVIPKNNDKEVLVSTKKLIDSLKRVSVFSNKKTKQTNFLFSENKIEIKAEDVEASTSAAEKVECNYIGEESVVAFNAEYLKEMLEKTETQKTKIIFKNNHSAVLILPEEQNQHQKISLLMPIRIS